jgi:hypothetical protein
VTHDTNVRFAIDVHQSPSGPSDVLASLAVYSPVDRDIGFLVPGSVQIVVGGHS